MASRSLNKVILIGNLTRDPELRYTPQGTAVCTFGLATNRTWQPAEGGERQEATEFHRIVAWQKLAELCSQLLFKGRKVYVEGRLQSRNWTTQDGQERSVTEVVIENMIILDTKRKEEEQIEQVVATKTDSSDGKTKKVVQNDVKKTQDTTKSKAKKSTKKGKVTDEKEEEENKEEKETDEEKIKVEDIPF